MKQAYNNFSPLQQLILLVITTLLSWVIISMAGALLGILFFNVDLFNNPSDLMNNIPFLKYFQGVQSIGLFIIPPLLFAWVFQNNMNSWLLMTKRIPFHYIIASIGIVLISQPLISLVGILNNEIVFPDYLQNIAEWMRQKENEAQEITEVFLKSSTALQTIANVLIIAVLPAIGEEFLFRGAIQRILKNIFNNTHAAVLVTAILFSAMHIQFFGFFPRFLLGLIFGYMVVYGGSIWLAVIAHFTNNFMAFVLYQNYLSNPESSNPLDIDQSYPGVFWITLSCAGVILILWWLRRRTPDTLNPYNN